MSRSLFSSRGREPTTTHPSSQEDVSLAMGIGDLGVGRLGTLAGNLDAQRVAGLLLEALETEIGGVQLYQKAIQCADNDDLRQEWRKYLDETRNHERILREVFDRLELDADTQTPGRTILRANADTWVSAMDVARQEGTPGRAQIVAAECVVLAETKDHMNWELIGDVAARLEGEAKTTLQEAHREVEGQEDEHLYHTRGWAREVWLDFLGLPAVLPPPEEKRDVRTMVGAARAQKARTRVVRRGQGGPKRAGTSRRKTSTRKASARRKR